MFFKNTDIDQILEATADLADNDSFLIQYIEIDSLLEQTENWGSL